MGIHLALTNQFIGAIFGFESFVPISDHLGEKLRSKIEEAFELLTRKERSIIELSYGLVDGYFYLPYECSGICQIPKNEVVRMKSRALRKFRNYFSTPHLTYF